MRRKTMTCYGPPSCSPQGIYNKYQRETVISLQGLDLYGKIPISVAGNLHYDLFVGTSEIYDDGGVGKLFNNQGIQFESAQVKYLGGGRLQWYTPLKGVKVSGNLLYFNIEYDGYREAEIPGMPLNVPLGLDIEMGDCRVHIVSIEYDLGQLTLAGEYYQYTATSKISVDLSAFGLPNEALKADIDTRSGYALISYRLEIGLNWACIILFIGKMMMAALMSWWTLRRIWPSLPVLMSINRG